MKDHYEFCQDCGEEYPECRCELYDCQNNDDDEFKFEYAFESITQRNSSFKKNTPVK